MESSRPWPWPRGASRTTGHVLGLGLGLEGQVLGLGLGLEGQVLGLGLGLGRRVLGLGLGLGKPVAVLGKNIWGPRPSSFGRQPRLSEITIEPISGVLPKI